MTFSAYDLAVARRPPVDAPMLGIFRAGDTISVEHAEPHIRAGIPQCWVLVPVFTGYNGQTLDSYLLRDARTVSYDQMIRAELHLEQVKRSRSWRPD
jgi:hypothetical protein